MELKLAEAQIEAILFTMGEAVELGRLAKAIEHDEETTKKIIHSMMDKYEDESRGIQIIELNGAYQLGTKASLYETIVKLTHIPKKHVLTDILLETLSIIAYKQPITKLQIEAIRGVKSDHAVNKLIEYGLVCELGRMDAPGKPILFGTTEEFLRCFGLQSLEALPAINPEKVEDFKLQAEEEAEQLTLDI
ncbi:SMC-Scp complex subunit ScpB [Herbinix luporum]|uniref:Segregation and condensation protein B n=1 Tax=Herbinix luporum TaxID=1679721 RepID=A0A0K8J578_9FIRM|nr:SMC-Scp complex subunit ScpB [Herbinix luporum]CUH92630.1 Segregation and condensation protein B [Herbinix luporum]HHT56732.1 SMC-Scp complex subunit ScpB [Herbinix luporum]